MTVSCANTVDNSHLISSNFAPVKRKYLNPVFDIKRKLAFWKRCGYEPTPAQLQAHMSTAKFVTLVCAARFGKSLWGGAEIAYAIANFPDFRCWAVATQYSLALNEFNWACDLLGAYRLSNGKTLLDMAQISRATRGQNKIQFPWGSFCETKSTDHPTGLFGASLDMVVLGEATHIKYDDCNRIIIPRLGDRLGRMLIPSTASDAGGMLRDYFDMGKDDDPKYKDYDSFQYSIYDNPYFDVEEVERARASLEWEIFAEQYLGQFVSRMGRVFKAYNEDLHCFGREECRLGEKYKGQREYTEHMHSFPAIIGLRYKDNNPVCAALIKVDARNRVYYVVDEFYKERARVVEVCDWVKKKSEKHLIRHIVSEFREKGVLDEFKKQGLNVKVNKPEGNFSAKQAYTKRIRMMQELLEVCELRGVPRIFVYDQCTETKQSFDKAAWPKERPGKEQSELPQDEYMFMARTISLALAKSQHIFGEDIYK